MSIRKQGISLCFVNVFAFKTALIFEHKIMLSAIVYHVICFGQVVYQLSDQQLSGGRGAVTMNMARESVTSKLINMETPKRT